MKKILILLIAPLLFVCCKPSANFTTDSTVYAPGEVIQLKNTSTKGKKFKWTFPDGTTSSSESPIYLVPDYQPIGSVLNFKLEVTSFGKIRKDEVSRAITIGGTGTLSFYTISIPFSGCNVTIDNNQTQSVIMFSSNAPLCGDPQCANFVLPVGSHTYKAVKGIQTISTGTIIVKRNSCVPKGI